jgi:hypothetical protein
MSVWCLGSRRAMKAPESQKERIKEPKVFHKETVFIIENVHDKKKEYSNMF